MYKALHYRSVLKIDQRNTVEVGRGFEIFKSNIIRQLCLTEGFKAVIEAIYYLGQKHQPSLFHTQKITIFKFPTAHYHEFMR